MPNKYIKKKTPRRYTEKDIINAVREVNDGLSMYAAAHKYGIPSTTLYDKIKATYSMNVSNVSLTFVNFKLNYVT